MKYLHSQFTYLLIVLIYQSLTFLIVAVLPPQQQPQQPQPRQQQQLHLVMDVTALRKLNWTQTAILESTRLHLQGKNLIS